MKTILCIAATRTAFDSVLSGTARKAQCYFFMTQKELTQLLTMKRLDQYDLILITAFDWRINFTAHSLTAALKQRFDGPILAMCNQREWRQNAEKGGATHLAASPSEARELVQQLLFPPTT